MNKSTFYHDGYKDASKGEKASPPDISIYASEYMEGYNDFLKVKKSMVDNPHIKVGLIVEYTEEYLESVCADQDMADMLGRVESFTRNHRNPRIAVVHWDDDHKTRTGTNLLQLSRKTPSIASREIWGLWVRSEKTE